METLYTCAVAPQHLYCTDFPVQRYSKSVARNARFDSGITVVPGTRFFNVEVAKNVLVDIYRTFCFPPHLCS
jgi:hypothetical protein